jgi:hypothetical protein
MGPRIGPAVDARSWFAKSGLMLGSQAHLGQKSENKS